MKKRIAILFAILLLLGCASASAQKYYTLPEIREQAAAGWHETYTNKYGRETVVDIDVEVFGEDIAPILKLGFPDYIEYTYNNNSPYTSVVDIKKKGELRTEVYLSYNEKVDLDRKYGEGYGNDLTLREMYDFLKEVLRQLGLPAEDFVYEQPTQLSVLCSIQQSTGEVKASAFYDLELWQKIYELPIMGHAIRSFDKYTWPYYRTRMNLMMRNEDEYSLFCANLEEREMIVEDIPLCSLDQVIGNLESLIEEGYIQEVLSLRFGYSLYNDPNFPKGTRSGYDAECYYAVPSWVVECIYMDSPKKTYSSPSHSTNPEDPYISAKQSNDYLNLVINAQTGEPLDHFDKTKGGGGDADYKGFIPWDEVN